MQYGGPVPNVRSERTRTALLDALEHLIRSGALAPSARDVAAVAGVSERSLYAHFASVEDLHAEMAGRAAEQVIAVLHPIDPGRRAVDRIVDLCEQRAAVHRQIGPLRRAAAVRRWSSPALQAAHAATREASTAQLRRVFAAELDERDEATRERTVAVLDALLDGEAWDRLVIDSGLDDEAAILALTEAVTAVLGAPPVPARRAPADPDDRVARLLDSLEAGAPPELIAPRLRRLVERPAGGR